MVLGKYKVLQRGDGPSLREPRPFFHRKVVLFVTGDFISWPMMLNTMFDFQQSWLFTLLPSVGRRGIVRAKARHGQMAQSHLSPLF